MSTEAIDEIKNHFGLVDDGADDGTDPAARTSAFHAASYGIKKKDKGQGRFKYWTANIVGGIKSVIDSLSQDDEGGENSARKYWGRFVQAMVGPDSIWSKKFRKELAESGCSIWAELWNDVDYRKSKTKSMRDKIIDEMAKRAGVMMLMFGASKECAEEFGHFNFKKYNKPGNIDGWVFDKIIAPAFDGTGKMKIDSGKLAKIKSEITSNTELKALFFNADAPDANLSEEEKRKRRAMACLVQLATQAPGKAGEPPRFRNFVYPAVRGIPQFSHIMQMQAQMDMFR
ncbi:MAG: hypothetical protein FWE53_04005 [Firmicutes bacterium]|nr:hypothetical protein [Bacillota bacterium]